LERENLTTAAVSTHVAGLQTHLTAVVAAGQAGRLSEALLLNPLQSNGRNARFLAFRHPDAPRWRAALATEGVVTDVRADVLRVGLGLYHDEADIDRFAEVCRRALG
jgi:selenocysteine lyase/cysteine desulfurase